MNGVWMFNNAVFDYKKESLGNVLTL